MADKKSIVIDKDLEDLIPGYLERLRNTLESMKEMAGKGDAESLDEIRKTGHNWKGSGKGYGFDDVTRIGAALEQAGKDQDADNARKLLSELEDYLGSIDISFG